MLTRALCVTAAHKYWIFILASSNHQFTYSKHGFFFKPGGLAAIEASHSCACRPVQAWDKGYVCLLFCFVLDSYSRRYRNRACLWSTHNVQLETCLVVDGLTLSLSPPHNRIIPTPVGTTHGTGALNWRMVLGTTLAIINLAALYCTSDLFIPRLWKGSTGPYFAPHPGTC